MYYNTGTSYILNMSKEEQEAMELLRRNAIRTPNRYEGIKAVEALAAYGYSQASRGQ
jgi:5-formaminoimidazole-4-carboxamide-1-beta-D-ribofuranosyl 5'-monophosphate synthetase